MATAARQSDCGSFFESLAHVDSRVLLLDYDGTLAPFCADRSRALPYAGISELLDCIRSTTGTRLALVTGRPAHEVVSLLGLHPHPEIWGAHGLQRLKADGELVMPQLNEPALIALANVDACLEAQGLRDIVEFKPGATAVHWRGFSASVIRDIRRQVMDVWDILEVESPVMLTEFDGGLEFRVAGRNKGDAARTVLAELGYGAKVAYLGDDLTDEDAFLVVKGVGLGVLVREAYRATAADLWLRPPDGLFEFLHDWLRACGGHA